MKPPSNTNTRLAFGNLTGDSKERPPKKSTGARSLTSATNPSILGCSQGIRAALWWLVCESEGSQLESDHQLSVGCKTIGDEQRRRRAPGPSKWMRRGGPLPFRRRGGATGLDGGLVEDCTKASLLSCKIGPCNLLDVVPRCWGAPPV